MQPLNNNTGYNTINSTLKNNTQAQKISSNPELNVNIPEILVKNRNIANNQLVELEYTADKFIEDLKNNNLPNAPINILGDLKLNFVRNITYLPENLTVAGSLILTNVTNLVQLPCRLKVSGDIKISSCHKLTSLPKAWLANMPDSLPVTANNNHEIFFEMTGVSPDLINHYNNNTPSNVSFNQRGYYPQLSENNNLEEVINFWQVISNNKDNINIKNLTVKEFQNLHDFLYNLTLGYSFLNSREYLANIVINILKIITTNSIIKKDIFLTLNNISALITSKNEYKIFIYFLELELLILLFNAEKQTNKDIQEASLLNIAKQKLTIEEIKSYAITHPNRPKRKKLAKSKSSEKIILNPSALAKSNSSNLNKTILTYLIRLAKDFSLSITIKDISNEGIFNNSKEDIRLAYEEIKQKLTSSYVNDWLINWEPWKRHKRQWALKSYTELPRKRMYKNDIDINSCCVLSNAKIKDIKDLVSYKNQPYSYKSLCDWFIKNEINPVVSLETINLDEIYSLKLDEASKIDTIAKKKIKRY